MATPLNIAGSPADNPLVDTPLLRQYRANNSRGEILLPASTIKGKLRGEAQRLAQTFGVGGKLCNGRRADTMCPAYWWDQFNPPTDDICLICRLFGSPWQPAALQFSDVMARIGSSPLDSDATVIRPGIGLSRVRGTAQENLLFFVETTPALEESITFANCRIEGEVPDMQSAALLWAAVQQVAAFGNGRSRGRGWLKPTIVTLEVDGQKWNDERVVQVWRDWLGLKAEGGQPRG